MTPDLQSSNQYTGTRTSGFGILATYLVALLCIPAFFSVGPLGGRGSPAALVGLACLGGWVIVKIGASRSQPSYSRPIRRAALLFVFAALVSYVAAAARPSAAVELRGAQQGLLLLAAWIGTLLVASDLLFTRRELRSLMRLLTLLTGLVAALGLLQWITGMAFVDWIEIPGLTKSIAPGFGVDVRNGFNRPPSTTSNSIELAVLLAAVLPLCLVMAIHDRRLGTVRRWFPVATAALVIPLLISRSAIVCAAISMSLLIPALAPRTRRWATLAAVGAAAALYVGVPGLASALLSMFSVDSSTRSRVDSYGYAFEFVTRVPVFGRGFSTFLPAYRILDNGYLGVLIGTGFFGLLTLLGLFGTCIWTALQIRARATDRATRDLAQALLAGVSSAAVGTAFFDAFSFPVFSGVVFVLMGMTAALWRFTVIEGAGRAAPPDGVPDTLVADGAGMRS